MHTWDNEHLYTQGVDAYTMFCPHGLLKLTQIESPLQLF